MYKCIYAIYINIYLKMSGVDIKPCKWQTKCLILNRISKEQTIKFYLWYQIKYFVHEHAKNSSLTLIIIVKRLKTSNLKIG